MWTSVPSVVSGARVLLNAGEGAGDSFREEAPGGRREAWAWPGGKKRDLARHTQGVSGRSFGSWESPAGGRTRAQEG